MIPNKNIKVIMKATIIGLVIMAFILTGCNRTADTEDKLESKSVSQIQQEKGIPVRVEPVELARLETWKSYTGDVEGAEQVTIYGSLGDVLDKIHVTIGDCVEKDQIVASYETDNPSAKYRQAEIAMDTHEKLYQRMTAVYQAGGTSQQTMDEIESQYKVARENFHATAKLINVKSPISGVVVDVFVESGEPINPGDQICKVARIDSLKTTVEVDENDIVHFEKGQDVRVTWRALPDQIFMGKIHEIAMSADPEQRSFAVEILIDNENNMLRSGVFVTVDIRILNKDNVIIVPRNAVFRNDTEAFVFIAQDGKAVKKTVQLGLESGNRIEIISGLDLGDLLIIEGQTMVDDQSHINVVS
ncbi:efflux RND transporter periplasmic adaptor subunit [bacterium]|nr:efflux RND transporter periplasmic adaptor subunit [candidate division CSSED10-310 bacterium]